MAVFSESEINEAKRRVRDMQSRASKFASEGLDEEAVAFHRSEEKAQPLQEKKALPADENGALPDLSDKPDEWENSQLIILALVMLLSHEEADSMIILALLYLLF